LSGAISVSAPTSFEARFEAWDGSELALVAPKAHPPGARLDGTIDGLPLRLKVHRCRRRDGGAFVLVGRPVGLRRETRDALDALARDDASRRVERW